MKRLILIGLILMQFHLIAQINSVSYGLHYYKIIEFEFDEINQEYNEIKSIEEKGIITVNPKNISISSYNNGEDKNFKIKKREIETDSGRDLYTCKLNGEKYAISISQDKKYLTQIGLRDKFIYEISKNENVKREVKIIQIDKIKTYSVPVYLSNYLDKKPLISGANNFDENYELIAEFIKNKVKDNNITITGKTYISITINELGKIEKARALMEKDEKVNEIALKLVYDLPIWTPGEKDGHIVKSSLTIEVRLNE